MKFSEPLSSLSRCVFTNKDEGFLLPEAPVSGFPYRDLEANSGLSRFILRKWAIKTTYQEEDS